MFRSVRKALPLAAALLLAALGVAFAGDNTGVVVSITTPTEISDVDASGTFTVSLSAANMVGVKQYGITLQVSPAAAANIAATTFASPNPATWFAPGLTKDATAGTVYVGVASFTEQFNGEGSLGTFTFTAAADFTTDTEATVTVTEVSLGPSSTVRDVFGTADLNLSVSINPPPPPVVEPTLMASSAVDATLDYSEVGEGGTADGSAGEVTFSVAFTDATAAAGEGQAIAFAVSNSGSESVYVLGSTVVEVAAGASETVTVNTDATGAAAIMLDAEADRQAGSTSVAVTASTTAPNSDGVDADLSVEFSASWDVPVAAELAAFAAAVTPDQQVVLEWSVASQTNNLGWEVYRSIDSRSYQMVGDLVTGEGTTDQFRTYSFMDTGVPQADVVYYYLRQVDLDGTTSRSSVVEVALATAVAELAVPTANALRQNYPNPFNPETTISFDLSVESVVTLRVYDVTGQVVRTLASAEAMAAGRYESSWDGRNEQGLKVGSGVYLYRLEAGDFTAIKKMTLLQ